jgi:transposase
MKELEKCTQEELIEIIQMQAQVIKKLQEQNAAYQKRITELERILKKDSHNSSKPPSSDGFQKPKKTKSERTKTGRPSGGQKGHKGHTLAFTETPDQVILHSCTTCQDCGNALDSLPSEGYNRRQVWEIPPIQLQVTEHRTEIKSCPCCHQKQQAPFPDDVASPIPYGKHFQALVMYWNQYQLIPFDRTIEMIRDLFGHSMSEGTIANMTKRLVRGLESTEQHIKEQVLQAPVIHVDETGMQVNGQREWLHVYSTDSHTYYSVHEKRGGKAMDEIDILPAFKGTAVHDAWQSYFRYDDCSHALCNAHLLRELTFLFEQEQQEWAKELHSLLLSMKQKVDSRRVWGIGLDREEIASLERSFDGIIRKGCEQNPPAVKSGKKRGRTKQSPARNLLNRLLSHRPSVLSFLLDPQVPFDNNQAERDVRMTKVKQKISGTFRSSEGAKAFCRIRGFISTLKKQGKGVLESIQKTLLGEPVLQIG